MIYKYKKRDGYTGEKEILLFFLLLLVKCLMNHRTNIFSIWYVYKAEYIKNL